MHSHHFIAVLYAYDFACIEVQFLFINEIPCAYFFHLYVIIVCGGSYRRGKASCGDMDIVITHPDGER